MSSHGVLAVAGKEAVQNMLLLAVSNLEAVLTGYEDFEISEAEQATKIAAVSKKK